MKALVTGGAGFIGSGVVRLLLENGASVRVLDNFSTGWRENLAGLDVDLIDGDVRDRARIADWVDGVDTVFHLAACIGNVKSLGDPWVDSEINVLGTVNLLEAARKAGVKKLVYSSSAATFGELKTMPIAESHPQEPDSPYGVSKLAAEKHCLCFGRIYGMTVVCLRYFNVYGINQRFDAYGNVIPIFAQRLHSVEPLLIYGDGEQTRDFVNVRDVARANWLAATRARASGVYNI
ncbi:MAG: NAD-dependent epimerase/dehydratase family protein, partial [Lentisphaerae bacterium]|nr:NAD-dependent epimerase/dehydratase family protein [Lentisphaerota bacterium]